MSSSWSGSRGRVAAPPEAEAGIFARMYSTALKFREPIYNPNRTPAGEVDAETPGAIIEATTSKGGKIDQVTRFLDNRLVNPTGKPVILYAPGYTQNAERDLYAALGPDAPVYIARSQSDLIDWIQLLEP